MHCKHNITRNKDESLYVFTNCKSLFIKVSAK